MKPPSSFCIIPLDRRVVEQTRHTLRDGAGHQLVASATKGTGSPCRYTLRKLRPGEMALLMSYSPFEREHPYRESGPIYLSCEAEQPYTDIHRWPPEIDPTERVFRAYSRNEEIIDTWMGTPDPEKLIADIFAQPAANSIHVRSLTYGCFTFKITRG